MTDDTIIRADSFHETENITQKHKTSNIYAICSIMLTAIGVGILEIPKSIAQGGWVFGFILLGLASGISTFMANSLIKAFWLHWDFINKGNEKYVRKTVHFVNFEQLGGFCFGRIGEVFVGCCVHLTMIGLCSILLILLGDNLNYLSDTLSRAEWIGVSICILLPIAWLQSMKNIGRIASVGIAAVFGVVLIFIIKGFDKFITNNSDSEYRVLPQGLWHLATAFANFQTSFGATTVFSGVANGMKNPQMIGKCVVVAYFLISIAYAIIGLAGYIGFGDDVQNYSSMVEALTDGSDRTVGVITSVFVIIMCAPHYILLLMPVSLSLDGIVYNKLIPFLKTTSHRQKIASESHISIGMEGAHDTWSKTSLSSTIVIIICRSILVLITVIIAIFVPSIKPLISLLGAVTVMFLVTFLPGVLYLRMKYITDSYDYTMNTNVSYTIPLFVQTYFKNHLIEAIFMLFSFVVGVFVFIFGTIGAIKEF